MNVGTELTRYMTPPLRISSVYVCVCVHLHVRVYVSVRARSRARQSGTTELTYAAGSTAICLANTFTGVSYYLYLLALFFCNFIKLSSSLEFDTLRYLGQCITD